MKAAVRLLPHGLTYLVVETETTAEADLARRLAHQYSGKHLTLRCAEAGGQVVLGLEPMPADVPKDPPAPPLQVERRYTPPSRPGVGEVTVTRQGAPKLDADRAAVLAAQPWRVPAGWHGRALVVRRRLDRALDDLRELESELDRAWQDAAKAAVNVPPAPQPVADPVGVGSYAAPQVPATELRRLLDLAWERSTDADADVLAVIERWLAKAGAPAPASCKVPAGTTAEAIVRSLAASDPNFRGHDPQHECSLCGVLGARTPEAHKASCPWRMARAWVA